MMNYPKIPSKPKNRIHALALGSLIAACLSQPVRAEDAYEENDSSLDPPSSAMKLNDPLSAIAGVGEQFDQDWFSLNLPVLGKGIRVDINWLDVPVNENLTAFYIGGPQNGQTIYGDGPLIFTPTGAAKVVVAEQGFGGQGRRYDLRYYYTDEDPYEEPNLSDDRYNAGYRPTKNLLLSDDQGFGKLYDSDDFRLQIPAGQERLVIDCLFAHAQGDVDLILLNPAGAVELQRAESVTDHEQIVYDLPPEGGNYHIIVYSATGYTGQLYNLIWTTTGPALPATSARALNTVLLAKCKRLKKKFKIARKKGQKRKEKKFKKAYRRCLAAMR